jgi:hypothetical protein
MNCVRLAYLYLPSCVTKNIAVLLATTTLAFAQQPAEVVETAKKSTDAIRKQVPTDKEAIEDHAEFHSKSLAGDSKTKSDTIAKRIKFLQQRQAEYLKNVAAGKIKPNADLSDKWDKIQKDAFALRHLISDLNKYDIDNPNRLIVETKILSSLQEVGQYLLPASHPKYTPRTLDKSQIAEMERIEKAIETIDYGTAADRKKAKPVKLVGSGMMFTLIQLPVPLVLKSEPNEKIYLTADTGGAFSNGLSLIELETSDEGIAKTTWVSIGESVATCYISMYSKIAIERQEIQIEVVTPSLAALDGLPKPNKALLKTPLIPKKLNPLNK